MITAAMISRDDDWILSHKLRVLSFFCDRVCVLLDRSPQSEAICRRFPGVEVQHWEPSRSEFPMARDGPTWDEGSMRQRAWDWAARGKPKWIVLGDTDEIPTPGFAHWLLGDLVVDDRVKCWYGDWVNLIHDAAHAIGGQSSPWSFQKPGTNKKGVLVRYEPGRDYRYRLDGMRHVRMEPSPLLEAGTGFDAAHKTGPAPLIHYKWANWPRWTTSEQAGLDAFNPWPPADAKIVDVSGDWLWRWDADAFLRRLPEPIAVVGNGPLIGRGPEIDAHATVIRFNNWRTEGFEADAGTRTTVWCTNCWDDIEPRAWPGEMFTIYTDAEQPERMARALGCYPHLHTPRVSWTDAARKLKEHKPSTGLVVLARLAHHGKRAAAFGFDGMVGGHYWDAGKKHDHTRERTALATLAAVGVAFR